MEFYGKGRQVWKVEERFLSNFNHGEENQIFSRVTGVIAKNEIHGLNDSREAGSRIAEIEDARWNAERQGITSPRNTNKGQLYAVAALY